MVDFGKYLAVSPAVLHDQAIEVVQSYKYLCTVSDDKLSFLHHVDTVMLCLLLGTFTV